MAMPTATGLSNTGVVSDPIADMLTRIRNANKAHRSEVYVPSSKLKRELARVLTEEGYLAAFEVEKAPDGPGEVLRIQFKTRSDRQRVIGGIKRISKPGLRVYAKSTNLPRVLGGLGVAIISTSSGLLTDRQAAKKGVGGEVLAYVW